MDLVGKVFGQWTVLSIGETVGYRVKWICKCSCGNIKHVQQAHLIAGNSTKCRNCGTKLEVPKRSIPEYAIWKSMRQRCNNGRGRDKIHYQDRGIKVCDRWNTSFENFLEDMGRRPEGRYSIDRIDVNGDYEPNNCRWADDKTQANNTTRNHFITHNNETLTVSQWADKIGIPYKTFRSRMDNGWDMDKIINTPIKFTNRWHNKKP